jgi:hypothetical protein
VTGIEILPFSRWIAPAGSAVTTSVGDEDAVFAPPAFEPRTTNAIRAPASDDPSVYVDVVAPEIVWQCPPELSQRCQLNPNAIGCVPLQLPTDPVSVLPTLTLGPEIDGFAVFTGAPTAARTAAVTFDAMLVEPALFIAVTMERRR